MSRNGILNLSDSGILKYFFFLHIKDMTGKHKSHKRDEDSSSDVSSSDSETGSEMAYRVRKEAEAKKRKS